MTRPRLPVLVASCAVATCGAAVSACGGAGHGAAAASSGHALFTQACGACHTLNGHNDPRRQGGDLRRFHASPKQFLQLASEMPMRRPLSQEQLQAVVRFVMAVEASR